MGSFDWRRRGGGLAMSPEALRVFGHGPSEHVTLRTLLRMVPREERRALLRLLHEVLRQLGAGHRRAGAAARRPPAHHPRRGRARVQRPRLERRLHRHRAGRHRPPPVAEDKIRHLANFDALTGLPNRRQLIWRAERALEHARRMHHQFALLLIDLDRFKVINDTLGHAAGDEMLMEVSRRLRACVRHSDQVMEGTLESAGARSHRTLEAVGRLGGDEFVALLPEVAEDRDAERVAQRMLEVMREPIFVGGQECFVTASVGVALFPRDGGTVADLLRNSDVAMYSVKGRAQCLGGLRPAAGRPRAREARARDGAAQGHRARRTGAALPAQDRRRAARMVGAEALMRWQRGDAGAAGDFIPLAEETGLIVPMSEWALREAARQARLAARASASPTCRSRSTCRAGCSAHRPHRAHPPGVTNYGVPHRMILLEITETVLMKDLQNVIPRCTGSTRSASRSRSTTSAPATRRWPT
jgi:GGDEF domain-containing protein